MTDEEYYEMFGYCQKDYFAASELFANGRTPSLKEVILAIGQARTEAYQAWCEDMAHKAREAQFNPNWASTPGDTIADILEERGITVEQFASQFSILSLEEVVALLDGKLPITPVIADQLAKTLGATPEFWFKREAIFQQDLITSNEPYRSPSYLGEEDLEE